MARVHLRSGCSRSRLSQFLWLLKQRVIGFITQSLQLLAYDQFLVPNADRGSCWEMAGAR